MEDFQGIQTINEGQHWQELRQRINAKAENLLKWRNTERRTKRWAKIAVLIVILAILVALIVFNSRELYAWTGVFFGAALVADCILYLIMRHYLTRMKNPSTPPQYYRDVKRFITTHKLRLWIPLAVAFVCTYFVKRRTESWPFSLLYDSGLVLGAILGSKMRNWFLDDDFCFDVEELGETIAQESAA